MPDLAGVDRLELDRSRFRTDAGFEARGTWQTVRLGIGKSWSTSLEVGAVDLADVTSRTAAASTAFSGRTSCRGSAG